MVTYDDEGYAANKPFRPEVWGEHLSDMPPGVQIAHRSVPPGFLFGLNFIEPALCTQLIEECSGLPGIAHGVAQGESDTSTVMNKSRISETVDIFKLQTDVVGLVRETFLKTVAPYFGAELEWFERPEILRYREGGRYMPHSDAENWFAGEKSWKRVLDRDISILLYLNEDFTGGEISFPNFGLQLKPQRGMLIAFPSDARYLHTARPLKSGVRYGIVSWAARKGSARVQAQPGDIYRV